MRQAAHWSIMEPNQYIYAQSPPPIRAELGGGLDFWFWVCFFFTADQAAAFTQSQHLQRGALICTPAPPSSPALFTISQPSGGLLPRKSNCSPGRQAGLAMTHVLSVECSLFKGLAGEEAKFKARLPEKITCHVKIAAI